MQRLEVSGAVRPIYGSLGVKRLRHPSHGHSIPYARQWGRFHPKEYTDGHGATLMVVATNLYEHTLRAYLLPYDVTATVWAVRMNRKN